MGTPLPARGLWVFSHVQSREYLLKGGEKGGGFNALQGLVIPMTRTLITTYIHTLRLQPRPLSPPNAALPPAGRASPGFPRHLPLRADPQPPAPSFQQLRGFAPPPPALSPGAPSPPPRGGPRRRLIPPGRGELGGHLPGRFTCGPGPGPGGGPSPVPRSPWVAHGAGWRPAGAPPGCGCSGRSPQARRQASSAACRWTPHGGCTATGGCSGTSPRRAGRRRGGREPGRGVGGRAGTAAPRRPPPLPAGRRSRCPPLRRRRGNAGPGEPAAAAAGSDPGRARRPPGKNNGAGAGAGRSEKPRRAGRGSPPPLLLLGGPLPSPQEHGGAPGAALLLLLLLLLAHSRA